MSKGTSCPREDKTGNRHFTLAKLIPTQDLRPVVLSNRTATQFSRLLPSQSSTCGGIKIWDDFTLGPILHFFLPTLDSHPATNPLLALQTMRDLSYDGQKAYLTPIPGEGKLCKSSDWAANPETQHDNVVITFAVFPRFDELLHFDIQSTCQTYCVNINLCYCNALRKP